MLDDEASIYKYTIASSDPIADAKWTTDLLGNYNTNLSYSCGKAGKTTALKSARLQITKNFSRWRAGSKRSCLHLVDHTHGHTPTINNTHTLIHPARRTIDGLNFDHHYVNNDNTPYGEKTLAFWDDVFLKTHEHSFATDRYNQFMDYSLTYYIPDAR